MKKIFLTLVLLPILALAGNVNMPIEFLGYRLGDKMPLGATLTEISKNGREVYSVPLSTPYHKFRRVSFSRRDGYISGIFVGGRYPGSEDGWDVALKIRREFESRYGLFSTEGGVSQDGFKSKKVFYDDRGNALGMLGVTCCRSGNGYDMFIGLYGSENLIGRLVQNAVSCGGSSSRVNENTYSQIQNGHHVDPSAAVTAESFVAQYGTANENVTANGIAPISAETFLRQYGRQSGSPSQDTGVTAESFLAQYGGRDVAAPRAESQDDAEALAAKSQFVMDEAEEGSDTYRDAKAMKEWLDANKEKFDSFSPERKARIAEGINQEYDYARKQRGRGRVFWDSLQRSAGRASSKVYQGWQKMLGNDDSEVKIQESKRRQELNDILNPKGSPSR